MHGNPTIVTFGVFAFFWHEKLNRFQTRDGRYKRDSFGPSFRKALPSLLRLFFLACEFAGNGI
jgi:hypothetical protein